MNNYILVYGEVLDYPQQASIDKSGNAYYKFNLAVTRNSGIVDILPVIVQEDTKSFEVLADIDEEGEIIGQKLLVSGEIRTRNLDVKEHSKVDVSIRAFNIEVREEYLGKTNQVIINGHICKGICTRETPRGIKIADVTLAVNREDGSKQSDYIPSVMWNGTAIRATERLNVGECIEATGRLQSREYIKKLGSGEEEPRTAFELSVNSYEPLKTKETV
ncbi:MAG: single-stranded DNA-binding protein [Lachnotalea sp.]